MTATPSPSPLAAGDVRLPLWVGTVDLTEVPDALPVPERYRGARLVLTRAGTPVDVVDLDVVDGRVDLRPVLAAAADLATPPRGEGTGAGTPDAVTLPSTTVATCTRDRPEHVAVLVEHLLALPDPDVRLLVVDNASRDGRTREIVAAAAVRDPRLRYVREERPGLSRARNRVLAEADTEIVAFVDDDVRMRPGWLGAVRRAFARPGAEGGPVACVTGPVLAGALETPVQLASETALGWTDGFVARRFALDDPPADAPLFPFTPGGFGVGANVAVSVAAARAVGGFDERLGPGSPTRGGEDIEFWVRLITAGGVLQYEPSCWLFHHHRDSDDALHAQLAGYANGLGGYLAAVACHPTMRSMALRRAPRALRHLARLRRRESAVGVPAHRGGLAPRAVARGVLTYLRLRLRR